MAFPSHAPRGLGFLGQNLCAPCRVLLGLEEPELTDFRKHAGGLGLPPGPEPRVPLTDLETALVPPWASVLSSQGLRCPICIMGI